MLQEIGKPRGKGTSPVLRMLELSRSRSGCAGVGLGREARMEFGCRTARSSLPAWLLLVNIHVNDPEPLRATAAIELQGEMSTGEGEEIISKDGELTERSEKANGAAEGIMLGGGRAGKSGVRTGRCWTLPSSPCQRSHCCSSARGSF